MPITVCKDRLIPLNIIATFTRQNHVPLKIGIFGDIHEDVTSLTLTLKLLESEKCDDLVCLGDIVGIDTTDYGHKATRDAETCIRLVKENCTTVVVGNHDLFAIKKVPFFTAGFDYPPCWYSLDLLERQKRSANALWDYTPAEEKIALSETAIAYLNNLPEFAILSSGRYSFLFSHHLYPDVSGSTRGMPLWLPDTWRHLSWMKKQGCTIGVSGHTHLRGTLTSTWIHFSHTAKNPLFINHQRKWLTCLPVTRGRVPSGCLVLDSEALTLSIRFLEPNIQP